MTTTISEVLLQAARQLDDDADESDRVLAALRSEPVITDSAEGDVRRQAADLVRDLADQQHVDNESADPERAQWFSPLTTCGETGCQQTATWTLFVPDDYDSFEHRYCDQHRDQHIQVLNAHHIAYNSGIIVRATS